MLQPVPLVNRARGGLRPGHVTSPSQAAYVQYTNNHALDVHKYKSEATNQSNCTVCGLWEEGVHL